MWLLDAMSSLQIHKYKQDSLHKRKLSRGLECTYILCQKTETNKNGECLAIQGTYRWPVEVVAKGQFWGTKSKICLESML